MKSCTKVCLLSGIVVLLLGYSSTFAAGGKNKPMPNVQKSGSVQKAEAKLTCDQKPGFAEKIINITAICTSKIDLLMKLDTSLNDILPLVKKAGIKTTLQQLQTHLQTLKANYIALKAKIIANPQNICGQEPVWKTYNEETKILVQAIKKQFNLLKNK
ncbi:MAG: hypothetical protein NTX91_01560 [candidate division SR1 bacterium]|nr:hypothetical protein [candidate division SR1 bacterium]